MFQKPSLAYIDAGTASMLFQLAVGGALAALLSIKLFWRRVMDLFRIRKKNRPHS